MSRFDSINFYQNKPKIELFLLKKRKIFEHWGLRPQTPKRSHPIAEFWLRAGLNKNTKVGRPHVHNSFYSSLFNFEEKGHGLHNTSYY